MDNCELNGHVRMKYVELYGNVLYYLKLNIRPSGTLNVIMCREGEK
jgi:hypothetical protein